MPRLSSAFTTHSIVTHTLCEVARGCVIPVIPDIMIILILTIVQMMIICKFAVDRAECVQKCSKEFSKFRLIHEGQGRV